MARFWFFVVECFVLVAILVKKYLNQKNIKIKTFEFKIRV